MTRADLNHCGKMLDAREELNRYGRDGRIESRHSIKRLVGMRSKSHDIGTEVRMHSLTVNWDSFSNEEKVAVVLSASSFEVEVTCTEAISAHSFSTLLAKLFMKRLGWSSLREMVCNTLGGCLIESVLTI